MNLLLPFKFYFFDSLMRVIGSSSVVALMVSEGEDGVGDADTAGGKVCVLDNWLCSVR